MASKRSNDRKRKNPESTSYRSPSNIEKSANNKSRGKNSLLATQKKTKLDESITAVTSIFGCIVSENALLSAFEKDLFFERLDKEIVRKFFFLEGRKKQNNRRKKRKSGLLLTSKDDRNTTEAPSPAKNTTTNVNNKMIAIRERIKLGVNQCTRSLEDIFNPNNTAHNTPVPSFAKRPLLLILTRNTRPPTILSHLLAMAQQNLTTDTTGKNKIHVLILPGNASFELGKIFGIRCVSCLLFLSSSECDTSQNQLILQQKENDKVVQKMHESVDSFVSYVITTLFILSDKKDD